MVDSAFVTIMYNWEIVCKSSRLFMAKFINVNKIVCVCVCARARATARVYSQERGNVS
jgi:hypothetical protein